MKLEWWERGACIGHAPALFFPASKQGKVPGGGYRQARLICGACDVRSECLDAAMNEEAGMTGFRVGMRGGLSPTERDKRWRGIRWCWTCGDRFTAPVQGGSRYCSDECRKAGRDGTHERYRERVA